MPRHLLALTCLIVASVSLTTSAFAQAVTFGQSTYPLPSNGLNVYHVDLNNDGREDFIFAGNQPKTFEIVLSRSDGTYGTPKAFSIPTLYWIFTIGDFNGDGWPDLIFADTVTGDLYEYLNNGDGTLRLQTKFVTSGPMLGIAAGDFNHDGKIDLLFETRHGSTEDLNVWFGKGNGKFTKGPTTSVSNYGDLYVGDFDGDGKADVVIEDVFYTTEVTVLFGDGSGHFPASTNFSDNEDTWFRPFDVNGDGKMDLVGNPFIPGTHGNSYYNLVRVNYGSANRTFQSRDIKLASCNPNGYSPTIGDFNGDGINDIAVLEDADCKGSTPYTLNVLLGNADGTYQREQQVYASNDSLWGLGTLRLDRDSKADLQLVDYTSSNASLILFSDTTFANFPRCDPPDSSSGIVLCAPTSSVAVSSPIRFSIAGANQTAGRKVEVWVDGKKLGETFKGAFSYYGFLDRKFKLRPGSHTVTIYSAGWDNLLQSVTFPLAVGTHACAAPGSPGLNVCSPLSSSRVASPVLAWATGTVKGKIARMEVWVDGVKKYSTYMSNSLKTRIPLVSGQHVFNYFIVNTMGQKWEATVHAEVE